MLPPSTRFPRTARLRKSREYDRVQRSGRRIHRRSLVIVYKQNQLSTVRIGLSVSRKVGNAVVRNRVKRWLREAARRQRFGLEQRMLSGRAGTGVDIVLIARSDAATSNYADLLSELEAAFETIEKDLWKELA